MNSLYAGVIVEISHDKLDRPFEYRIPDSLREKITIGSRVSIPFGNANRTIQGYVVSIGESCTYPKDKVKDILDLCHSEEALERRLIQIAAWMSNRYGSTMIAALKTVLPIKNRVKERVNKIVTLAMPLQEANIQLEIYQKKNQMARYRLLAELIKEGELSQQLVTDKLSVGNHIIQAMSEKGEVRVVSTREFRSPLQQIEGMRSEDRPVLSDQQKAIADRFREKFCSQESGEYLLHGITGSGKTEVYLQMIETVLSQGKQAIVLIPEIALTYQTVRRFQRRFAGQVSIMNSKLSAGEKYDQMMLARSGEVSIMIGPRSALFTPFPKLGLIVIDEEHEGSYKSETMPRYHAREVARAMSRLEGISVVYGSATPSIDIYADAKKGLVEYHALTRRLTGGALPRVYVEDLRTELKEGNRSMFSRRLQRLMQERLLKKEQIMLFINRRGLAGFVSCRSCGYVAKCQHCDVSLSEHRGNRLSCHYCGHSQPMYARCPECGSTYISGFRAGTQQIEDYVKKQFPSARVLRMDADSTRSKDSYDQILGAFSNLEADILIGTQMIVKGHDFPMVTLVGVIAADLSLYAADYRASERTFQLLTQAAGRAGRGVNPGEVIIQTYQPDHYAIQAAAAQDYEAFYEQEMLYREMMNYPPVGHMLLMMVLSESEEVGKSVAKQIADLLLSQKAILEGASVIGPAAAAMSKRNDLYRFVIYCKHASEEVLSNLRKCVEFRMMDNYEGVKDYSIQFDLDPMSGS